MPTLLILAALFLVGLCVSVVSLRAGARWGPAGRRRHLQRVLANGNSSGHAARRRRARPDRREQVARAAAVGSDRVPVPATAGIEVRQAAGGPAGRNGVLA